MSHTFKVKAKWVGGLDGHGSLQAKGIETPFSAPEDLKGSGVGANPEELLLSAASGGFILTVGAALGFQKIPVNELSIESEGELVVEGGMRVTKIHHSLVVVPARSEDSEKIAAAISRAKEMCIISKALKGNVTITVGLSQEKR